MTASLDLKELERQAFQRTYQDGLWEIYLGGLLASFAAFGFTVFPGGDYPTLLILVCYLAGMGLSGLVFFLGKKMITLPRIGLVNFGPQRQKRTRDLAIALGVIAAVQVLALLLQFGVLASEPARAWVAPLLGDINGMSLGVGVVAVLFVSPGMLLIAYKMEVPHGYYDAVVMALSIFLMIVLDTAWWMAAGGGLIALPGIVQLVLFLRQYPLEDGSDDRA